MSEPKRRESWLIPLFTSAAIVLWVLLIVGLIDKVVTR